jgi:hypothetical protein
MAHARKYRHILCHAEQSKKKYPNDGTQDDRTAANEVSRAFDILGILDTRAPLAPKQAPQTTSRSDMFSSASIQLRRPALSILEKIVLTYQTDNLKKFYPQDPIYDERGYSCEGLEFLSAISSELVWEISNSKDFKELARRHKFMK